MSAGAALEKAGYMKRNNWKSVIGWLGLSLILGPLASVADEAGVKKSIEAAYPKIKVDSVTRTPYAGL